MGRAIAKICMTMNDAIDVKRRFNVSLKFSN